MISWLFYFVFTAEEPAFGDVCALPDSFVARFSDRGTQILPAEMIAPILPTLLHPGCLVLVFSILRLDNSTFRYMTLHSRLAFTKSSARDPWISFIFSKESSKKTVKFEVAMEWYQWKAFALARPKSRGLATSHTRRGSSCTPWSTLQSA